MLKIGNYLNFGTKKGSASNFTLDLFTRLAMTKATGKFSKSSLLDFLINSLLNKEPAIIKYVVSLCGCEGASKLDLTVVKKKLDEFKIGLGLL
jgi:hypothetical protein